MKAIRPERETTRLRTILAVPDIHAPFHDELALSTCVAAVAALQPDHLVILGDACDSYDISDFPRDPARKHSYKDELAAANEVLDRFSALRVPDVRMCEGNHEWRLARYLAKRAPELHGLLDVVAAHQRAWVEVDSIWRDNNDRKVPLFA